MAYTVPQFNVPVDFWSTGHIPDDDPPDFENVSCQFYIYSRVSFDVQPCELELYQPPMQLRVPRSAALAWVAGQVFEVPAESGRYYRARYKDRVHLGFPNEYLVIFVVQCGSDGIPVLRDIEGAVPCGGPTPGLHEVSGFGSMLFDTTSNGTAERDPIGGVHNATGNSEIQVDVQGQGSADNQAAAHETEGDAAIAATVVSFGDVQNIP